jgi:electron transport complex, RnfABCDGE type, D subunit
MDKLVISPAPHIHSGDSVSKNMLGVIIALVPAYLAALYFFGLGAFIVSATAVLSCVLFEYLIQRFLLNGKTTICDYSAILTGLLLSFNLPSNLPIWMVVLGSLVAIGIGKMSFGGLGNNPFNPALVGRVFLLISCPVEMNSWPRPVAWNMHYLDAETGATPLAMIKNHFGSLPDTVEMLLGQMGGSLGEISAIALLVGLIYLLIRKIITWHIPVSVLASVFVFTGILYIVNPETYASPLVHLLTGGLLLGAIFMATDYVTSPMSKLGMIIYGIGIGVITVVIRVFGAYPEGVSFAILIMNAFTPLINTYIKPKKFGETLKIKN